MSELVLVLGTHEGQTSDVMERLGDEGFSIVGPAPNASSALCLASVTFPDVALFLNPPTGRRDAVETASALLRTWGVSSVALQEALPPGRKLSEDTCWLAREDQLQRLRRAISGAQFDAERLE
jgi:hypothetical protein